MVDAWRSEVLSGKGRKQAIVNVISLNKMAFNGLGRHLANDLLHELAIFPGTPAFVVCEDEGEYQAFRQEIYPYLAQFVTEEFLKKTSTEVNSANYLDFNITSNRYYLGSFLKVFRREMVRVPAEVYNKYKLKGLLDENHTICTWSNFYVNLQARKLTLITCISSSLYFERRIRTLFTRLI